jgi:transcriptional regulator of met regulon
VTAAAFSGLSRSGQIPADQAEAVMRELGIDPADTDPRAL